MSLLVGLQAQDLSLAIPVNLDIGTGFARIDRDPGVSLSQGPGALLNLSAGLSLRYKKRIGVLVEGGLFLDSHDYSGQGVSYDVALYAPRWRAGIFVLTEPVNKHGSLLHIGFFGGYSYYTDDSELHTEDQFSALSETEAGSRFFISPEIGFTQFPGSRQFDMMLYYTHHLSDVPGYTTTITTDNGDARARSFGNSIGIRLRYHLRIKPPKPVYPAPPAPEPSPELLARNTRLNKELRLRSKRVKLVIRDNADEDGDEISIALNGEIVLDHYTIVKKKKKLKLYLDNGANHLIVFAHNEGTIPPNTAEVILRSGWKKYRLIVSSGLDRNEEVLMIVE